MGKKIYKRQIIKYNDVETLTFNSVKDATDDAELKCTSSIYRLIKNGKQYNGYYYKFGELVVTREKYRNRKPYYILASECTEKKNPEVWDTRVCPICGNVFYVRKRYKRVVCSEECHKKYMEIYGDEINNIRRMKSYNNYRSKTPEEIKLEHEKAKKTCLERYGYDCLQKTPEYRKKMSETFKSKDWSDRSEKIRLSLIPKYKEICEKDNLELLEFRNRFDCTVKCKTCGNVFDVHVLGHLSEYSTTNLCRCCHPNKNALHETKPQQIIMEFLDELSVVYEKNNRSLIPPYEVDIYIPKYKIGLEINGNFWHSEFGGGREKEYHINKTKLAKEKGVKLLQIYEDEIIYKSDKVKSYLSKIFKLDKNVVDINECNIKEVGYEEKHDFFEKNHIDGDCISSISYGLYYNNILISCLSVCKRKNRGNESFEIVRFCDLINYGINESFYTLFDFFVSVNHPKIVKYFLDVRWNGLDYTNKNLLESGFKYVNVERPTFYYVEKNNYLIRLDKTNFTKKKLRKRGFDNDKTEKEIMIENGFDRIWNCGYVRYQFSDM